MASAEVGTTPLSLITNLPKNGMSTSSTRSLLMLNLMSPSEPEYTQKASGRSYLYYFHNYESDPRSEMGIRVDDNQHLHTTSDSSDNLEVNSTSKYTSAVATPISQVRIAKRAAEVRKTIIPIDIQMANRQLLTSPGPARHSTNEAPVISAAPPSAVPSTTSRNATVAAQLTVMTKMVGCLFILFYGADSLRL